MHPAWRRARILITDADAPTLQVYDVEFDSLVEPVALPEPAEELVMADGGEYLLVRGASSVTPVYAGVSILDHSEGASDSETPHIHVYKYPPTIVDVDLSGLGSPVVGALGHEFAVAYSSGGDVSVRRFEDHTLVDPETFALQEVVIPDRTITAVAPAPDGEIAIVDPTGLVLYRDGFNGGALVPGIFGPLAHVGGRAAFGYPEGVVVLERLETGTGVGARPTRRPFGVGLHVDRDEVIIAGDAAMLERFGRSLPNDLPSFPVAAEVCDVLFEPGYGEELVTLSVDGVLRTLDADTGEELASRELAGPFRCDDDVRPRLAAIPARAYVLLPEARELVELWIDADLRELTRTALPGSPRHLRAAGFDLETRNLGDLSDVE
jgi:hypothetical protein